MRTRSTVGDDRSSRRRPRRRPGDPHEVEARAAALLKILDASGAEAARLAGAHLVCARGCFECCLGPFPITRLDAWQLRRGLQELEHTDAARARAVRGRARQAARVMSPDFPGDPRTGRLDDDDAAEERFAERHASLPCPALDPSTGSCDLYAARPVSCRTYGPPVSIGGAALPPCRLCFTGATADEVERCRVAPDPGGAEEMALAALLGEHGEDFETLVAFALAGGTGAPEET